MKRRATHKTVRGEPRTYMIEHMWDDCPKWPYSRVGRGYGVIRDDYVHVLVCEKVHGPRPSPNHVAAHNCGKGHLGCFGAKCIEWKTRPNNELDRVAHGTSNRGEACGTSRLKQHQVIRIRGSTGISDASFAKEFGVSTETIRAARLGVTWGWL